jgi:class 3 adenylate cyclase/tetratricopeptide (TPR) repeat protein
VCGASSTAEGKFCDNCGASLPLAGALQAAYPRVEPPISKTPSDLAKWMLTSKATVEGERKQITVLCADVKGSTEHVADLDPEDARRLLDPVLERMMEAVHRYGGTVNQVMGDGIQALFGAPLAYEDHAVRACYAALKMQESIKKLAEEIRRTQGIPLQIRVGLNSGEVIVRSLRSELHVNYSAQGETMHLAARMEQMALPGTIMISSHSFQLAEGYVVAKPLGPMFVKGLAAPVASFELVGAKALHSRLQAVAARGLTRFVGRRNEIELLRQGLAHVHAGHGQVIAVVGEPGVGKSRLIREFIHSEHTRSCRLLEAQAVSYGTGTSYLPVTDFLRGYFQIATSDESLTIREKITGKLLNLGEDLLPTLPALLTLLDLPPDDSQSSTADPPQRRQRTLEAVKRLLFRESAIQPLLLVLEDLHSIDPETQVLMDGLVDALPTARLLLLVSYRPEYQHRWSSKTYYTQIRVDPLTPAVALEMLHALVGTDSGLEKLKHFLIEKTEGTPFFLEESVRALVETGILTGKEPEGYCATRPVSDLKVPSTLEALLTSRIDRLSPVDKRLLQCAAVIGDQVPLSVLQDVGELPSDELREALNRLRASEFLYETSLFPDIEYTFKHALIHDAAYQMLATDRRCALHTAALLSGESIFAEQASEKADWLAFHAFRAQKWDRAVIHLQAAAAREIARAANRVAAQHLENALKAVDHLGVQQHTPLAIDLRIGLRHALTPLGKVERTLHHLQKAEQLATELNDKTRLGRVVSFIANCLLLQAQYGEALHTAARALKIAEELRDHRLELATKMYMARARLCRGERQAAIDLYRDIIRALDERPPDELLDLPVLPAVVARSNLAASLAEGGAFVEAAAHTSEAVRRADASAQPDSVMWANWGIGLVALVQGEAGKAVSVFERLLDMCRVHDLDAYASRIMAALGLAKARAGHVIEGLALLEQAVALDASAEPQITKSFALTSFAEAIFLAGDLERALIIANQAVQRTRTREERSGEAYACWLVGVIHNACAIDVEPAANMLQAATAIATELGFRPLLAHCQFGLGDLHDRRGFSLEASAHRERGRRLLRELGMRSWFKLAGETSSGPL